MTQSIRNASQWALMRGQEGTVQDGSGNTLLSGPGALLAQNILRDAMSAPDGPAKQSLLDGLREAVNHVRLSGGAITAAPTFPTWAMYVAAVGTPADASSPTDPVGSFFTPPAAPVPAPVDPLAVVAADPTSPAWLPEVLRTMMPQDQDGRPGPAAPLHRMVDAEADIRELRSDLNSLMASRRSRGDGPVKRFLQYMNGR